MNNEQAQLILACRRPNGADDADPAVREALEQARLDPALGDWLRREQEWDAAVSGALARVRPPERLRAELLAGQKLVRLQPWWRRTRVLAIAAVLMLLGAVASLLRFSAGDGALPAATYADMRHDVSGLVAGGAFQPTREVGGMAEARAWLSAQAAPEIGELPAFLSRASTHACSLIEWRGRKVAGVCLVQDGKGMHLFVLPRRLLDEVPRDGEILRAQMDGHSTLTWNSAENVYVLVAETADTDLSSLPGG